MALVSPGVQVTVTDESQYVPSVASSVPYILLVTAQNKASGSGPGIAPGTLKENANKLYLITSQSDLLATFGQPFFYNNITGTPINGYELNEYGLLAAYSALGQTTRCYVQRADIDLTQLTASLTRPQGTVADGTLWFDPAASLWGLNTYDASDSTFAATRSSEVLVLTDGTYLNSGSTQPLASYGTLGQIALVTVNNVKIFYQKVGFGQYTNFQPRTYKEPWNSTNNTWQIIGSAAWARFNPVSVGAWVNQNVRWPFGTGVPNNPTFQPNSAFGYYSQGPINTNLPEWVNAMMTFEISNFVGVEMSLQSKTENGQIFYRWTLFVDPNIIAVSGNPIFNGLSYQPRPPLPFENPDVPSFYYAWQNTFGNQPALYGTPRAISAPSFNAPLWNPANAPVYTNSTSPFSAPVTPYAFTPWRSYAPTGSVWQILNALQFENGMKLSMKKYSAALNSWIPQTVTNYNYLYEATYSLNTSKTVANIPPGTLISTCNIYQNKFSGGTSAPQLNFEFYRRRTTGPTVITGVNAPGPFVVGNRMLIIAGQPNSSALSSALLIINGTSAQNFVQQFNLVAPTNVSAQINGDGLLVITHSLGGEVVLNNVVGTPVTATGITTAAAGVTNSYDNGTIVGVQLSNWSSSQEFSFITSNNAPTQETDSGTVWYYADPTVADIMIQNGGAWCGYRTVNGTTRGENLTLTNASGPIFSATAPTTQNNPGNSPLVAGDLWIDTSDLENYPVIYRWTVNSTTLGTWKKIINTDQTSINGIIFADARWSAGGTLNPSTGALPTITSLLVSNYTDPDAPNPALYAQGTLLFNTRRSGYNVKQYQQNYFTSARFPGVPLPPQTATWLSISGNKASGPAYMGRQAQRAVIVKALKSCIDTSTQIREEQKNMTLIACPQYPELAPNMVALNNERNNTSFVLVDTPLRLSPQNIVEWATNNNGQGTVTEDGLLVADPYAATWYPSCLTNDLAGNQVVTAPTHMMIRAILRNDYVSYPWFAPAGTQRGIVDNAIQIGYLKSDNKFEQIGVNQGIRDVLYTNRVNPITVIPGAGIVNFGNKTTTGLTTALDRINVARLVAFLRAQLESIAKVYLFEPNDEITRNNITNAINGLMIDLVAKRALYDYLVVCDLSNNTPDRIDRNELWVDIAIEPVKAIEFIYIPVRIKNTGSIQANI